MAKTTMPALPILYKHTSNEGTQIWQIEVEERAGNGVMITTYGLVDGKKQRLEEAITKGKNVGKKNETTPFEQACNEAQGRWNKQKDRKGYGLTVEESKLVRAVSPMLAHKYKDHFKKVDWDTAFAQPKLNGFRCLAHRQSDGTWVLRSRENQPLKALDHVAETLKESHAAFRGPTFENIILDGEIYTHGLSLNTISSLCKRKQAGTETLKYHVYDVALHDKTPFEVRGKLAQDLVGACGSEFLEQVETVKVRSEADLRLCEARFLEAQYEGAMLRHTNLGYQAGKRASCLLKVKVFEDDEFQIIDYKMNRGRYEGTPTFVCLTKAKHTFEVLCHGNMDEKRAIGKKAASYVGRMLTVRYFEYTKTDEPVPFNPVAVAFRE